jgi:hypothetical protein
VGGGPGRAGLGTRASARREVHEDTIVVFEFKHGLAAAVPRSVRARRVV